MEKGNKARRELKTRQAGWARRVAAWLGRQSITPNQISVLSVVCAACSGLCFLAMPSATGAAASLLPLGAAVGIQLRLLCNMLDGMIAVEGGKSTPVGILYNDIPDRLGDVFILVPAGFAITSFPGLSPEWGAQFGAILGPILGWTAGILAVSTAYVRCLGGSVGAPVDFCGPMAKQHRMFVLTVGCLLTIVEVSFWEHRYALPVALLVIVVGSTITCVRRTGRIARHLNEAAATN